MTGSHSVCLSLEYISERIRRVSEEFKIVYAVVFGSLVEGRVTEESDVDIAVKLEKTPSDSRELFRTLQRLVIKLDIPNVDLVILNLAPPPLRLEALTRGRLVFCRDRYEYYEDVLSAVKWYDDWLHVRRYFEERELRKVLE